MHAFVYHVHVWSTKVKEGIVSPLELRLRDSSELLCEWYLNIGPIEEQQVLLTAEPSLQPLCVCICIFNGKRWTSGVVTLHEPSTLIFWDRISHWDLEFVEYSRLGSQWTLGTQWSLPSQHWDNKLYLIPTFSISAENLYTKHLINGTISLVYNPYLSLPLPPSPLSLSHDSGKPEWP